MARLFNWQQWFDMGKYTCTVWSVYIATASLLSVWIRKSLRERKQTMTRIKTKQSV